MSPVYSLMTVLSHMCQEDDAAKFMGQGKSSPATDTPRLGCDLTLTRHPLSLFLISTCTVGGLPLIKALRDWMRCQDVDISESSLGFCGNLAIGRSPISSLSLSYNYKQLARISMLTNGPSLLPLACAESNIANVWRAHVLETILPVLARPSPTRKTAVFLLSQMALDFAMVAMHLHSPGSCLFAHHSASPRCLDCQVC
jgi:hypothetical protein